MRAPKKTGKKTAFVPRIIFTAAAAVGVVPVCVSACGGVAVGPLDDAGPDRVLYGVARACFDGSCVVEPDAGDDVEFTVAATCFDGGTACPPPLDAAPDIQFTVAAACFDGGPFCPDAFGVADAGFKDVFLGVAADAFGLDAAKGKG